MYSEFGKYIKTCRKAAMLTQEEAAYQLHISTRSLAAYEAGETKVPEDVVISLVEIYKTETIAFYYLKFENTVGQKYLPKIDNGELATLVIKLKKEIIDIQKMEYRLLEIASDGKIDETERVDWEKIQNKLEEAAAVALALRFL